MFNWCFGECFLLDLILLAMLAIEQFCQPSEWFGYYYSMVDRLGWFNLVTFRLNSRASFSWNCT